MSEVLNPRANFLPVTQADVEVRGWDGVDFVFVSGDAYVDHPSFGHALLARLLEREGYRVAMLAQPQWRDDADFKRFGRPRLGFLVSAGVIDSMVNHYTAAKKPRSNDAYAPGGAAGRRPNRATIVYCNRIRQAYGSVPIVIGGVEASLRRFAHYDYWDDKVRASILADSDADLLVYGMGEAALLEAARWLKAGMPEEARAALRGTCYLSKTLPEGYEALPSLDEVSKDPKAYCRAFLRQMQEQDAVRGLPLAQANGSRFVCQNPPVPMLTRAQLDAVYALPFERAWHPDYDAEGGVPALEEVKFSIAATRGCFGSCNFCALTYHQGRSVVSRSPASIVQEAKMLTHFPDFKGYIHDVGGPTANFRRSACRKQETQGTCKHRVCLYPKPCKEIKPDHREFVKILRELRALPGVKKVFVRSGLRYDYLLADPDETFLRELCEHHVSGQLKVAPEHISAGTLACMGKPERAVFDKFRERYAAMNERLGMRQYLVPYFMSSHPGSDLNAAIELAEYLRDTGLQPEQVQDFYPTPGTLSTCMFYTGLDPRTLQPVYVPREAHEKAMQRALLQYRRPQNHLLVREALHRAGREDLIGFGKRCLVPPARAERRDPPEKARNTGKPAYKVKKTASVPAQRANTLPENNGRIGRRPPRVGLPKKKT